METIIIAILVYAVIGFIACIGVVRFSVKKGKAPALLPLLSSPVGLVLSLMLWPLVVIILLVELTFEDEVPKLSEKAEVLENGVKGIVSSEMKLVGKIRVGETTVIGRSISGPLEIGEQVVIVGYEMAHYIVRRDQPGPLI